MSKPFLYGKFLLTNDEACAIVIYTKHTDLVGIKQKADVIYQIKYQ